MFIMMCRLELLLMEGNSLKEKRRVIRSIIERLQNRFNISIAEVGYQDTLRRTEIGVSAVSNEAVHLEKIIGKIINFVELDCRIQIINIEKEIY